MANNKIEIVIEVDGKQVKVALDSAGKGLDKLGKSAEGAGKSTKGFGQNMLTLQSAVSAIGLGALVGQTISFGKEAYAAAGAAERLGRATQNLASAIGSSGDAMVNAITSASMETISQTAAMEAANKALMFGLVEDAGAMGELTEVAVTLGAAMGQDATKSLDDLTTALGRQSPMILDNLGIIVKLEEAHKVHAATLGKTVAALTEEEKKQAFVNAALAAGKMRVEELGGVTLDSAGKTEQLSAAWADFQVAFGGLLTKMSGGVEAVTGFVGKLEEGADTWSWMIDVTSELVGLTDGTQEATTATIDMTAASRLAGQAALYEAEAQSKLEKAQAAQSAESARWSGLANTSKQLLDELAQGHTLTAAQAIAYAEAQDLAAAAEENRVATSMALLGTMANFYIGVAEGQQSAIEKEQEFNNQIAGIRGGAAEKQKESADALTETLTGIEQDRAEKLQWVMTGAHDRTAEENAAALGHWNTHYDDLSATATAKTKEKTDAVIAEQGRAEAAAGAARAKEKADLQAHLDELKLKTTLSMLETTGELAALTGLVGISASEAADLITAGLLPVTQELGLAMQGTATGLEAGMAAAGETATANQEVIAAAMAGSLTGTQEYAAGATEALLPVNTMFGETLPATLGTTGEAAGLFFENATLATNTMIETALTPFQSLLNDIAMVTIPNLQTVYGAGAAAMTAATNVFIGVIASAQSAINALALSAVVAMAKIAKSIEKAAEAIKDELIPAMKQAAIVADSLATSLEKVATASMRASATSASSTGQGFSTGTRPEGFIVPSGYSNDSFPMRVQSGERVIVQTPQQQRAQGGVSAIKNYYFNQTVNTNARASTVIGDFRTMELLVGA